jgi:transposase-like protein
MGRGSGALGARDLSARGYVYLWADGVYPQARQDADAQCVLVLVGATLEGRKELVGFTDGYRESAQSWRALLVDLKARGLVWRRNWPSPTAPRGFWAALREVFGQTVAQRCWVHKTANVLNKRANSVQPKAKKHLQNIWIAGSRQDAEKVFDSFLRKYAVKY